MGCLLSCCNKDQDKQQFLFFEEERSIDMLKKQRLAMNKPCQSIKLDQIEVFKQFIYPQISDYTILKSVRVKNKQTNGEPNNSVVKFLHTTILHHRFVELELLSKKNTINSIFLKLDWQIEEFTCTDMNHEENEDIIGIQTYMGKKQEASDLGNLDLYDFFNQLIIETDSPQKLFSNNCKHVALRVFNRLTDNDSNNFQNSNQSKNGIQKTESQLKQLFDQLNIDISKIKATSIQVIEKRYKNYQNFAQLLDLNDAEENLRVSDKMDSYQDLQSINIIEHLDRKKKFKLKLDDESITSNQLSELFNLNNIENVRILRLHLDNGNKIDVEMESSKINLIYAVNEDDLRNSRQTYNFNDENDCLVPIMEAKIDNSLTDMLKQLVDKNKAEVNNLRVNEIFNRVSQNNYSKKIGHSDSIDLSESKNFNELFNQEIFNRKQNKVKSKLEQNSLINTTCQKVVQDFRLEEPKQNKYIVKDDRTKNVQIEDKFQEANGKKKTYSIN